MSTTHRSDHAARPGALRLPVQSAPIDRTPAGTAALAAECGADASFDWGSLIGDVAKVALPLIAGAVG